MQPQIKLTALDPEKTGKLFARLIDSVRDYAIFLLDPDGNVQTWNAGAKRFKGYEAHEIIGKHFSTFYPAVDIESRKPWMELEVAAAEGRFEDEGWRVRKDGTKFWANVVITAIRDENGTLLGFGKVTRDLTDRREAEMRYRLLVEGVTDYAIYSLDTEGRITSWNVGAERIKGYTAEEIMGQHFSRFYTAEDRERGMPKRVLETALREGHYQGEGWRVRKDGTRFWSSVVVTPIYDEEKNLRGYSKVTRDVSDRKQLMEEIERHSSELEQEIKEHQRTNAELEAFSYSVAHDLRAPLRAVEGFASALREDFGEELSPGALDYLQEICNASGRMTQLVHDLLDYSRLSRSEMPLVPVSVLKSAQSATKEFGSAAANISVEVPKSLEVMAHGPTLVQILVNLIGNGLKFQKKGVPPKISITADRLPDSVRISVTDNGIGIDPAYQQKIFKVFERLHGIDEYAGTGIGLAIVKRGVERMYGTISLQSTPGEGSTFAITLPVAVERIVE